MNKKKDKILYSVWLTGTQSLFLDKALKEKNWDKARVLFEQAFMEDLIEKR